MYMVELEAKHSKEISDFYGMAKVITEGRVKALYDGGELIAIIDGVKAKIIPSYLTEWQIEEVKEFLRQNHFEVGGLSVRKLKERYR